MKHTNSFKSIKNNQKINKKNLELFNALSLRQKEFEPNSKVYSISMKNFINNKNKSQPNIMQKGKKKNKEKKVYNNSSPTEKDNNQINIKLNIKSEIINNNFSNYKNENKYDEILKQKNIIISNLEKELFEVKEKINKIQNKKKRINSVDFIEEKYLNNQKKSSKNKDLTKKKNQNLKPSNIISKNVKQFFKNLILKKESYSKENPNIKNVLSTKNLILNTSNYNNYIKHNHKNNLLTKNLYSNPTREIEIVEMEKNNLLTQTRKNSASMFKSNSFLFTSQNSNSNKRKDLENNRRCQSQFDTYNSNNNINNDNNNFENYDNENNDNDNNNINCNNEIINHNTHNKNSESDIFYKLNKLKSRTQKLLNNFLSFCDDK